MNSTAFKKFSGRWVQNIKPIPARAMNGDDASLRLSKSERKRNRLFSKARRRTKQVEVIDFCIYCDAEPMLAVFDEQWIMIPEKFCNSCSRSIV
jgi:hypothetical protein